MITTKRNGNVRIESYSANVGQVGLLERPIESFSDYKNPTPANEENLDEARARMQANLSKLLNYEKHTETATATATVEAEKTVEAVVEESPVVAAAPANADDDIRPTSTTMQFGDGDLDQMYKEMNVEKAEKQHYRLNSKGKLAVVLYSLAVSIILALIIFNTGLLASLKNANAASTAELNQLITETDEQGKILANADAKVNEWAIQNGMIK